MRFDPYNKTIKKSDVTRIYLCFSVNNISALERYFYQLHLYTFGCMFSSIIRFQIYKQVVWQKFKYLEKESEHYYHCVAFDIYRLSFLAYSYESAICNPICFSRIIV